MIRAMLASVNLFIIDTRYQAWRLSYASRLPWCFVNSARASSGFSAACKTVPPSICTVAFSGELFANRSASVRLSDVLPVANRAKAFTA